MRRCLEKKRKAKIRANYRQIIEIRLVKSTILHGIKRRQAVVAAVVPT